MLDWEVWENYKSHRLDGRSGAWNMGCASQVAKKELQHPSVRTSNERGTTLVGLRFTRIHSPSSSFLDAALCPWMIDMLHADGTLPGERHHPTSNTIARGSPHQRVTHHASLDCDGNCFLYYPAAIANRLPLYPPRPHRLAQTAPFLARPEFIRLHTLSTVFAAQGQGR